MLIELTHKGGSQKVPKAKSGKGAAETLGFINLRILKFPIWHISGYKMLKDLFEV